MGILFGQEYLRESEFPTVHNFGQNDQDSVYLSSVNVFQNDQPVDLNWDYADSALGDTSIEIRIYP